MPERELIMVAAESTAITHGNSLGYIPSGMMALIVRKCIYEAGSSLREIILSSYKATGEVFSGDPQWTNFCDRIDLVFSLSGNSEADISNIRQLGKGTTGDSALAIAVYCSLRYENDFSGGVIAAVNHDGDSDSTGAITGNLLGAWLGLSRIDAKWLDALEMKDIILEVADDLYYGVPAAGDTTRMTVWRTKYVEMKKGVDGHGSH